jgi:hypothetical protein
VGIEWLARYILVGGGALCDGAFLIVIFYAVKPYSSHTQSKKTLPKIHIKKTKIIFFSQTYENYNYKNHH